MLPLRSNALTPLLAVVLVTGILYLGEAFLYPMILSVLLAFLLGPVVALLEKWGIGRIASVTIVTSTALALIGLACYAMVIQLTDLVNALPGYQENLNLKIFQPVERLLSSTNALAEGMKLKTANPDGSGPMPVEIVHGRFEFLGSIRAYLGSLMSPLATAAVVIVNVVFFLFERQSLRDRFIHIVGSGQLGVTTKALDDAAKRVSKYLGAQLIVNVSYGIPVAIGLYFIGVPNAPLWGGLAIVLRFIPYFGAWISAILPIVLAMAISPSWTPPLLTIALFVGMELFSNYVVEPWLYGASTGLSPSAIIVSATFWTWLWGLGGLLLATPLTVCFAVLGKYIPAFSFLDVLLGANPPIAPGRQFYQRLLAGDKEELDQIIAEHLARDAALEFFDQVALPALRLAEGDLATSRLELPEYKELCENLLVALEKIEGFKLVNDEKMSGVAILPARSEADGMAAAMLGYLLGKRGVGCMWFSDHALSSEVQTRLSELPKALVVLSAFTPEAGRTAGSVFKRLGSYAEGFKVLGLWGGDRTATVERLRGTEIEVVTKLDDAVRLITSSATVVSPKETIIAGSEGGDNSAAPKSEGQPGGA